MLRRAAVLVALGLPLLLVHCAGPVISGDTYESSLVADEDAGDAGDAGDPGDAGSEAGDAGDGGDAAADAAAEPDEEADAAPPAPPKKPTKPVAAGDASDDAATTDPSSVYPDPSTVRLGPLPEGSGGCASAPVSTGLGWAPLLAMVCLVALRRRKE